MVLRQHPTTNRGNLKQSATSRDATDRLNDKRHSVQQKDKAIKCPNLSFKQKGGGREASPFFMSCDGSVPSTGQRRPGLPRADPAVLSARWGLASGFGTGPGVPPMLWPLTGGRRPPLRCPVSLSRALGAAWRIGKVTRGHPRARTAPMSACPAGREVRFRKSSGD